MTWQHRHPLAFNLDRDPIRLPPGAAAWRVRSVPRGSLSLRRGEAPEPVNGLDGSPLYLRLTDSHAELARQVGRSGLYRLDAVGADLHVLRNVEPAYVEIAHRVTNDLASIAETILRAVNPSPALPRKQDARLVSPDALVQS